VLLLDHQLATAHDHARHCAGAPEVQTMIACECDLLSCPATRRPERRDVGRNLGRTAHARDLKAPAVDRHRGHVEAAARDAHVSADQRERLAGGNRERGVA
jgi:hypothetical protein